MILPSDPNERARLYRNLVRECDVTRDARRSRNQMLRTYALTGTDGNEQVRRNKLKEFVDASTSYCYAPELIRFGVVLPPSYGDIWLDEEDTAREEMQRLYADTGADQVFGLGVEWAHIYDSVFFKTIVSDGEATLELVPDPSDIGVWRENLDSLDKQEAITHHFEMDVASFERLVRGAIRSKDLADEIVAEGRQTAIRGTGRTNLASATPRVLLAAVSPNLIGAVQNLDATTLGVPQVQGEVLELAELWVRDDLAVPLCATCHHRRSDDRHDTDFPLYEHNFEASGEHEWEWRKALLLPATERVLWETLNPLLSQRQPFRQLSLGPVAGYLWGVSPLQQLLIMQKWGEDKIAKHDDLLDLQLDPPIAIIGISSVDGERAKMLRQKGGTFSMPPTPGADIKRLVPDTPPDAAGMTELIDRWFDRAGGLPTGSQGQSDPNVRSAGQMGMGALLSSPRTNRRAMRVEDALEECATDLLRLHRRVATVPLRIPLPEPDAEKDPGGHARWQEHPYREFLLSQMPGDFVVRVSAHSASPLFSNETRQIAMLLKTQNAIDLEMFVTLMGPPLEDIIRAKSRRLQAAAAKARERVLRLQEAKSEAALEKARDGGRR